MANLKVGSKDAINIVELDEIYGMHIYIILLIGINSILTHQLSILKECKTIPCNNRVQRIPSRPQSTLPASPPNSVS
jgi:hypothetical protein